MNAWIPVDIETPPADPEDDFGDFFHSVRVLITNGRSVHVGYLQTWKDADFPAQWKLDGRDAYDFDGVTHWQELPPLPPRPRLDGLTRNNLETWTRAAMGARSAGRIAEALRLEYKRDCILATLEGGARTEAEDLVLGVETGEED